MSSGLAILQPEEADISRLINATTHIGSTNVNYQMQQYIYKRRADGVNIIDISKTWEKMMFAARAIVAIENPADVYVISSRPMGQRAVLKYAHYTGATPIAGRFTPGAFTNQIQAAYREPRLLIVTDPRQDHQPVNEASYVNLPVIAFTNIDTPLRHIDIAIPCNNKHPHSIGLMYWMLCREVLRLRGMIPRGTPWENEVMPDLFFFRDVDQEEEKKKAIKPEETKPDAVPEVAAIEAAEEGAAELTLGDSGPVTAVPKEIDVLTTQTGTTENWGGGETWN